jgi:hypothetical protein
MKTGEAKATLLRTGSIFHAARPLFPRIEALATKRMAVTEVNRSVHLANYNRLISAAISDAQQQQQQQQQQ